MIGFVEIVVFAAVLSIAMAFRARAPHPAQSALAGLMRSAESPVAQIRRPARISLSGANSWWNNSAVEWLETLMLQAAVYMPVANVVAIMAALLVGGGAAILLLSGDVLVALVGGIVLALVPLGYIKFCQIRRVQQFAQQLPEVLDMVKSSLEAGHSLHRALQVVAEEFSDPVSGEMRIILEQTQLGVSLPRAFEDMLNRMPEESLNYLVVAIKIQSEVGSTLAEIIGHLADTVRARHRIKMQIKALTAQPRMSGKVVGFLPFIVLFLFWLIQPDYTMMLFRDSIGTKILKVAIALDITAFLIIRRVLRSDY